MPFPLAVPFRSAAGNYRRKELLLQVCDGNRYVFAFSGAHLIFNAIFKGITANINRIDGGPHAVGHEVNSFAKGVGKELVNGITKCSSPYLRLVRFEFSQLSVLFANDAIQCNYDFLLFFDLLFQLTGMLISAGFGIAQ